MTGLDSEYMLLFNSEKNIIQRESLISYSMSSKVKITIEAAMFTIGRCKWMLTAALELHRYLGG